MFQRGKVVIISIFTLAIGLSLFAVWYHYRQGRRALRLWGTEAAVLIQRAPQVELLRLRPSDGQATGTAEELVVDGQSLLVVQRKEIRPPGGITHARHALVEDASFRWDAPLSDAPLRWQYALRFTDGRFTDGRQQATVLLDVTGQRVRLWEHGKEAFLTASIAEGMQEFIQEQFSPVR